MRKTTTAMKKNYIKPALKSINVEFQPFAEQSAVDLGGQEHEGNAETGTRRNQWGNLWND